tara:strand:- start:29014 stop:31446 length:2433 start_codon:yes stop_codon:yes gene_type:complete
MVATLQHGSSFGTTETQTIRIRIVDEINHPKYLEVDVASPAGNRKTTYNPFDEVRIVESDVTDDPVLFRGKIVKISSPIHPQFGQVVKFIAFDNLRELHNLRINDGDYSQNGIDALINHLIREHVKTISSSGINLPSVDSNTTKFTSSENTGGRTVYAKNTGKSILQVCQELAEVDPWTNTPQTDTNYGFHFYIDEDNDFNYYRNETVPSNAYTNGLKIVSGATSETDLQRPMLVGDSWDEITDDVITEIKCNYTLAGEPKVLRLKRLTHQSVGGSGYPFHANDEIRGQSSGTVAKVQLVTSLALIVSHVDEGDNEVPVFTAGETIVSTKVDRNSDGVYNTDTGTSADETGHASSNPVYKYSVADGATGHGTSAYVTTAGASAVFTTTPEIELGQKSVIELNLPEFNFPSGFSDISARSNVATVAAPYLTKSFLDIDVYTHRKGICQIVGFPWYRTGGSTYVVRAGNEVYCQQNVIHAIADNYTVSKIDYVQDYGSGMAKSTLYVTDSNAGAWRRTLVQEAKKVGEDAPKNAVDSVGRGQLAFFNDATASGYIPTSSASPTYGMFRYALDGGGGSADTLAFLSGQTSGTPAAATAGSAFWSMLNESDGSTGSRLLFEPIVDYDTTDTTKNRAWIGYHNYLFGIQAYYQNAGTGSASFPAHTFITDTNTGMYLSSSDTIGFSTGGTARATLSSSGLAIVSSVASDVEVNINSSTGLLTKVSSSRRYKDNIADLGINTENIYDLRPVSFDWKSNGKPDFGYIAEEVHEILPELTIYDDKNRPEAVKYKQLSILMLEELKKLRKEVKELKEKL